MLSRLLRWPLINSNFWHLWPSVVASLWVWARLRDLLLINRVCEGDSTFMISWQRTSILIADSPYYLLVLHTLMKQAIIWDRPMWQGTKSGLWPTGNEELCPLRSTTLKKLSCQQSLNKLGKDPSQMTL